MSNQHIELSVENPIAELGQTITGRVKLNYPTADQTGSLKPSRVRGVQVCLRGFTEGRGDTSSRDVQTKSVTLDPTGAGSFALSIPGDVPISYDGRLIRLIWEVQATVDVSWALDPKHSVRVLILPVNGMGRYRTAHPLTESTQMAPDDSR